MDYEFIITKIYFHWKSDLFTKFLYYENLEPYGIKTCASNFPKMVKHNAHSSTTCWELLKRF